MRMASFAVAAASVLLPAAAAAHPLDVGALTVTAHGTQVTASLDLSASVARRLLGLGENGEVDARALRAAALGDGKLTLSGAPCQVDPGTVERHEDRLVLPVEAHCQTAGDLLWDLPFIDRAAESFRLLVSADTGTGGQELILGPRRHTLSVAAAPEHSFWGFVQMGMQHIGATPGEWWGPHGLRWPDGIDHILFLVALLLAGVRFVPVLKTVTGFTLGHSVTLTLATLGIVQLPSRLVESAIALSIAYVAAEDLWIKGTKARWQVAAAFGLVHGFGFARALAELHLPRGRLFGALFGFNLGVELGQEVLVVLLAPVLWLLYRTAFFRKVGSKLCALVILAAALGWFVQRAFGPFGGGPFRH